MTHGAAMIAFHPAPLLIAAALPVGVILWNAVSRFREWLSERGASPPEIELDSGPRREALELIASLEAVRRRISALDRALTQRRSGVRWQFGIGIATDADADNGFRDADEDSDVDKFLSDATQRDLDAAHGEMISLFRDAANWLEKYAPEEVPPPSVRERIATFVGGIFLRLKRGADLKMVPVVRKTPEKRLSDNSEPSEKVADAETPDPAPKSREKLRLPLDLLQAGKPETPDPASLRRTAKRLAETLRTYKVDVIQSGTPVAGPSVTRYEFRLGDGVKLKKLQSAASDIALQMGAESVRIATVAGKRGVVGIEVPSRKRSAVALRDVLETPEFQRGPATAFALGVGIDGAAVTADLDALPHVLIAGTTGSGKSVCMNALIVSLLYKASPEELRLLLIDPKRVELTPYAGIPHLTRPVVTDAAQAVSALEGAVTEMMTRYKSFENYGVKDLTEYNRKSKHPYPRLVIVIDELSDLMIASGKEIEESVIRIAQMGRAAGIHLVIATQTPRADIVTGKIKANVPSRIALSVSSALESRIILDEVGAETLAGSGDMLYKPSGGEKRRVQGCYVSPEEIGRVVSALTEKASESPKPAEPEAAEESPDELLPTAVDIVLETGQASVSMLQRRLKLGYSRAAGLVGQMESCGYVGPFEDSRPRQILISREQWEKEKLKGAN